MVVFLWVGCPLLVLRRLLAGARESTARFARHRGLGCSAGAVPLGRLQSVEMLGLAEAPGGQASCLHSSPFCPKILSAGTEGHCPLTSYSPLPLSAPLRLKYF